MEIPIVIPTYSRIEKLSKCLGALLQCPEIYEHPIFVFIDGPKDQVTSEIQIQICEMIKLYQSYGLSIEVIKRKANVGAHFNGLNSQYTLTQEFGASIIIEDDIVVSKAFLGFMRSSMSRYINCEKVLSVTGFSPINFNKHNANSNGYFLKRYGPWGAGIWRRSIEYFPVFAEELLTIDNSDLEMMKHRYGKSFFNLAKKVINKQSDAQDVKNSMFMMKHNYLTYHPNISLVKNIGHDGSGVNSNKTKHFENVPFSHDPVHDNFEEVILENDVARDQNLKFRSRSMKDKLIDKFSFIW